jgi:hypothetical protein
VYILGVDIAYPENANSISWVWRISANPGERAISTGRQMAVFGYGHQFLLRRIVSGIFAGSECASEPAARRYEPVKRLTNRRRAAPDKRSPPAVLCGDMLMPIAVMALFTASWLKCSGAHCSSNRAMDFFDLKVLAAGSNAQHPVVDYLFKLIPMSLGRPAKHSVL